MPDEILRLTLTQAQFDDLHEAADGRREKVRVDRSALQALLLDHGNALRMLRARWKEPEETRRRSRLKKRR